MNILLVLIPVTLLVIVIAVALFFWAVNHQQFDDLDSPAVLPLMDDPLPDPATLPQPDPEQALLDVGETEHQTLEGSVLEQPRGHIHFPHDPDQG
ncbi:MAG: cbb3-type cytochrome oxidase assembly protein CcoS [Pseudomonadota bacterium]|nr:cbb3-type cytochrome oxidase assembly protein CcoS [Pseudomonadota bacterium]